MWPLDDDFADPLGRWNHYAPWDADEYYDSAKGFLSTQTHVDIRNFRSFAVASPRPQSSLEAQVQNVWDATTQQVMEETSLSYGELWALTGTGLNTLTIGPIAGRGGWSGLQALTTGVAVSAVCTSSIPNDDLDLSAMTHLVATLPDYNSFDGTSTIKLTSAPNGAFGTAAYNSSAVAFSGNLSAMPALKLALSSFASGAGASFTLGSVTGVQITLNKSVAPAASQVVTIMGLRAITAAWVESALDFDTRLHAVCPPVTLNGAAYSGTIAKDFEFIRGDASRDDPVPIDGAYNVYFNAGGTTSPDDATGSIYNTIAVLVRELKNTGAGTGDLFEGSLAWNDASTIFQCSHLAMSGGAAGTRTMTTLATQSFTALTPGAWYLFHIKLVGTQLTASLYRTDPNGVAEADPLWSTDPVVSSTLALRNGRVGLRMSLVSRDSFITSWQSAIMNFASLITENFNSVTPVNGAQLSTSGASDMNLFTGFTGPSITLDQTKTRSGNPSWSTSSSLLSNQFIVDDWQQTYLAASVWVRNSATIRNQPVFTLYSDSAAYNIPIPKCQANRWNDILIDLSLFWNLLTGVAYSIGISPAITPDRPLGTYWVDQMTIGRRRVSYAMRCTAHGQWREFRDQINQPYGAIHFNANERGNAPQLRINALTQDAWVAGFKLQPHYAELGGFVFDVAADT